MKAVQKRREQFGKFLAEKRKDAGLSQKDLSQILGYTSPQFVSNWERGLATPPIDKVKKICEVLYIPPSRIMDEFIKLTEVEVMSAFGKTVKFEKRKSAN